MHDIRLGSHRSKGWLTNNEQFRLRASINPTLVLGVVDAELWMLNMTPTSFQSKLSPISKVTKLFYMYYNSKGSCYKTKCPYVPDAPTAALCIHLTHSPQIHQQKPTYKIAHFLTAPDQSQHRLPYTFTPTNTVYTIKNNHLWSLKITPVIDNSVLQYIYLQHYVDRKLVSPC